MAQVGCPDRRIDRLCITCCSPSQLSHHAMVLGAISSRPSARLDNYWRIASKKKDLYIPLWWHGFPVLVDQKTTYYQ